MGAKQRWLGGRRAYSLARRDTQRKAAEEALRAQERARRSERDRLQQVLDTMPNGLMILDADARVTMMNQAAEALLGKNVVGLHRSDFDFGAKRLDGTPLAWQDLPSVRALALGEPCQGVPLLVHNAARSADIPVLQSIALLRDSAGSTTGLVAVLQDVSVLRELERERAALLDAVRTERDRLRQIVERLPVALILYDQAGTRVGLNRAATALLGADLLGQPLAPDYQTARRLDGTRYTRDELPVMRSMATGEPIVGEQMLLRHLTTGVETHIVVNSAALLGDDGSIQGGMAVLQDLSLIKALEQDIAAERDRLQQIFELLPAACILYAADGHRLQVNHVAAAMSRPDLLRRQTRDDYQAMRHPDGTPYAYDEVPAIRSLRGEQVVGEQLLFTPPLAGQETPVLVSSGPIRAADGSIQGAIAVFQDMSPIRALERERDQLLAQTEAARARLQQILDVLPSAVIILDAGGQVRTMNQAAKSMLGVDMVGRQRSDFDTAPRRADGTRLPWDEPTSLRVLRTGEPVHGMQVVLRNAATCEDVPVVGASALLHGSDDAIVGVVSVFQNISTNQAARAATRPGAGDRGARSAQSAHQHRRHEPTAAGARRTSRCVHRRALRPGLAVDRGGRAQHDRADRRVAGLRPGADGAHDWPGHRSHGCGRTGGTRGA